MKNSWSCRLLAMLLALMLALPGLGLAEDDVIIAENVEDAFFGDEIRVTIEKLSDTGRKITIEGAELC